MMSDQFADTSTPIAITQVEDAHQGVGDAVHVLGVCQVVQLDTEGHGTGELTPALYVWQYLNRASHEQIDRSSAIVRVLQQPQHGMLMARGPEGEWTADPIGDWRNPSYFPDDQYYGNDSLILQVTASGHTLELRYFLRVADGDGNTIFDNPNCKTYIWAMSDPEPK